MPAGADGFIQVGLHGEAQKLGRRDLRLKGDMVKFNLAKFLAALAFSYGVIAQAQEWVSVGTGYLYQLTESNTGHWTSVNGWYVLPTFNINRQVGVFADFANIYSKKQNVHVELTASITDSATKRGIRPSSLLALVSSATPMREPSTPRLAGAWGVA
jgi:hypothetical protein